VGELILFLEEKIAYLTELREQAELNEDWSDENYLAGCIDAYDIVRMKLTNPA
jgi:hypothetical protein